MASPATATNGSGTGTIQCRYNYVEAWQWLQQKGRETFGNGFLLHEEDKAPILLLLCWFLRDEIAAPQLGISLQKGILLTGPVGCGKTALMKLMQYITQQPFIIKPCRDIAFEFMDEGFSTILKYSRGLSGQPRVFCFDDLGVESSLKYYGNECNVLAEVLLSRYDLFIAHGLLTHITTNLSAGEIEQAYGNRIRSRMREQFNLVAFDKEAVDKRR
ncbi:MAG: AAA family ATPase [Bacteroidota bacterium]|nr:AAA family ATPase [Bacteroidota bacterium]